MLGLLLPLTPQAELHDSFATPLEPANLLALNGKQDSQPSEKAGAVDPAAGHLPADAQPADALPPATPAPLMLPDMEYPPTAATQTSSPPPRVQNPLLPGRNVAKPPAQKQSAQPITARLLPARGTQLNATAILPSDTNQSAVGTAQVNVAAFRPEDDDGAARAPLTFGGSATTGQAGGGDSVKVNGTITRLSNSTGPGHKASILISIPLLDKSWGQ